MTGETFGQMLRRLREARVVTVYRTYQSARGPVTCALSQNELALRAGLDSACINKLEAGRPVRPKRETVILLSEALDLSPLDTDRLMIAAGYWPWPDQAEDVERALAAVHGDRRKTG